MAKLCNNKLLAASLLEWTLGSKTTFLDAKENKDLIEKAKRLGIELPSPDLAAFETVYCEVDKFNRNGVKLPKKVAEKGLKTLIGKQCNWNHEGANQICGYIIDAEIKENKIYITGILFKSLFKSEFGEVMQLFENGQLYVSFELWNRNEAGESIISDLGNGYRELTELIAHGCALLLIDPKTDKPIPPACPVAQVKKLLASEDVIKEAEQIINSAGEKNESLVYAELATEEPTCIKCEKCTCQSKGGTENIMDEVILENDYEGGEIEDAKKLTTEQRNALPDEDFALIQERDGKKVRRFPINDEAHVRNALTRLPQAKDITEDEKKSALAKILKKAKELNMTELLKKYEKAEETAQVTPEPTKVEEPKVEEPKVEAEAKPTEEVKPAEAEAPKTEATLEPVQVAEAPVVEKEKPIKTVSYYVNENIETVGEDGGIDYQSKSYERIVRTFKDGREEIEIREGNSANDSKISRFTITQLEAKVNEVKLEKDTEITNLKTELDSKNQEIANLKVEKAKAEEKPEGLQPELSVGSIQPSEDRYIAIRKEVNDKAFGVKK